MQAFFLLPALNREQIFRTLRTVRIHITDPLPYVAHLGDVLRGYLPNGTTVLGFLRRLDGSTRHLAGLREITQDFVAKRILHDSPAQRLLVRYREWEYAAGLRLRLSGQVAEDCWPQADEPPSLSVNLDTFRHKKSSVITAVANCVSASASVFAPAIDKFDEGVEDSCLSAPMAAAYLLNNALSRAHAFDAGHTPRVKWIEGQRTSVLAQTDRHGHFYPAFTPEPLIEIDSVGSVPIQAADIAASIAKEIWYRDSLVHLVRHFEYVTYNGERVSEDRAAWYQRVIGQMG